MEKYACLKLGLVDGLAGVLIGIIYHNIIET